MIDQPVAAALTGGVILLERALAYTLGCLHCVTAAAMPRPTPCRGWDLRALLAHMDDSLAALHEAAESGEVSIHPSARAAAAAADPAAALRHRACRLLGAWTAAIAPPAGGLATAPVASNPGRPLHTELVAAAGAVEVAVHGWDVARACGRDRPIPPGLAEELLDVVPLLVSAADRPVPFGPALPAPPGSTPGDRLVAFLGRRPA
jgi:uncharacterized protein (TIGR03086 family)